MVQAKAQQEATGLVAGVGFQVLAGAGIQQVHQVGVVRLGETVNQLADQQVGIQLQAQGPQLAAGTAIQNGLRDSQCPAEARDNSPQRRDLDMAGRVSHQIDITARQLAADGNPPGIDGNSGPLESSGFKVMPFQEAFQD